MNRVFKTKWSVAHQEYVVTDEKHTTKTKATKSAVALAVSALMMMAGGASAAYLPGYMNDHLADHFSSQSQIWETAEYQKDWGLAAMKSSSAYALGFTGKGVAVGVMDSGALLQKHPDLAGNRFQAVAVPNLDYGSTGNRYPQDSKNPGEYKPGADKPADGNFVLGMNDSHGTHVTGTVGGNRDGSEFHGVAFDSDVFVGNTGGTDSTNYGPFQDPQFFYQSWSALADAVAKGNTIEYKDEQGQTYAKVERGGFINNSFGTNIRIVDADGDSDTTSKRGEDGGSVDVHFPTDTVSQTEYEYFLFKQDAANRVNTDKDWNNKSFVDAAYEALFDENGNNKKVVQVFTTGNRDFAHPFYRPLYPYFNPDAEQNWIAVAGMKQGKEAGSYELYATFNEAGNAKWWTVAAPGSGIYSSKVNTTTGEPSWGNSSGTSMAAPHVTGALAVLMDRYDQMDALQVRDVMFTTANHKNADGSNFKGWTAAEGEVDVRYGWGMPDLEKGMFGPGQFLGEFNYDMAEKGSLDVWSNDISQTALNQRNEEDHAWLTAANKWMDLANQHPDATVAELNKLMADTLTKEECALLGDILTDTDDDIVGIEDETIADADAIQWRKDYYQKRIDAINARVYKGSLNLTGNGTLVMLGNNSYEGETTVGGNATLLAFAESIGHKDDATKAAVDPEVTVKTGGTFGVLSSYDDQFTQRGHIESKEATAGKLTINVETGGTLYVDAASTVKVKAVNFNGTDKNVKIGLAGADSQSLIDAYNGKKDAISGTFETADANDTVFNDVTITKDDVESVFFELGDHEAAGNKITTTMVKKDGVTIESFANNANQQSIAAAIAASGNALTGDVLASKSEAEVAHTLSTLDDDFYVTARNALVTNATQVTRAVIDQASGMGEGRRAEFDEGRAHVWATGMGRWGDTDGNAQSLDVDFTVGMVGAEFNVCQATKLGAFFGYGDTDYSGAQGKIDGEDKHFGIYGLTDIGNISMTYGIAYTDEDRDTTRYLGGTATSHSENASVLQGFVEGAYNFDLGVAKVSPYVGFTWARVETDDVVDGALGHNFKTEGVKDDIQIASIGARGMLPFTMGTMPVAVKADLGYSHFFGDTDGIARVQMGEGGQFATIEGSDLKGQVNFGLGIVGKVAKHATVGVSYTGAWGSDVDSHGIMGNLRINF